MSNTSTPQGGRFGFQSDDKVKHIHVKDSSGRQSEEPLDPYMVPSKYLASKQWSARTLPPKRPLGGHPGTGPSVRREPAKTPLGQPAGLPAREPVKMYSQIAAPAAMGRVRRPRTAMSIPVASIDSRGDELLYTTRQYGHKAKALFVGAAAVLGATLISTGHMFGRLWDRLRSNTSRVHYSQARGADIHKLGVPLPWWKVAAPVTVLALLFGLALFNATIGNGSLGPGNGGRGGGGDNAVIEIRDSASNNNGAGSGAASPPSQGGAANQVGQGGRQQVQGSAGSPIQPSFSPASGAAPWPVGGMGGGAPTSSVTPPATSGGGGGAGGTGGTGGDGGSTSTIPTIPLAPLPTINPGDCLCGTIKEARGTTTDTVSGTLAPLP